MPQRYLNINNYLSVFVWVFTALWLALVALAGIPAYFNSLHTMTTLDRWVIAVIMLSGLVVLVPWSLSIPISKVTFDRLKQQVSIKRIYLGRRKVENHRWHDITGLDIEQTRDSEGDPYFKLNLVLANGRAQTLAEGHVQASLETQRVEIQRFLDPGARSVAGHRSTAQPSANHS